MILIQITSNCPNFWSMKCCDASIDVFCFAKFIAFSIIGSQLSVIKASNLCSVSSCMLSKIFSSATAFYDVYIYIALVLLYILTNVDVMHQNRLRRYLKIFAKKCFHYIFKDLVVASVNLYILLPDTGAIIPPPQHRSIGRSIITMSCVQTHKIPSLNLQVYKGM